ncbi:myomegalin-like, partial [Poecilia formosa]|uniref:myomegalin-like n=1 Tax=Poecilia formosa TaxID=48698 RepID=UPI0007BAA1FD
MEVKQLVEQKQVVDRELGELKAQLEKAGFSSLSQMRRALFSLRSENEDLKLQLAGGRQAAEEKEELDVTVEEEEEEEESSGMWEAWDGDPSLSDVRTESLDDQKTEEGDRAESLTGSSQDDQSSNQQRRPDVSPSVACGKTVRLQLKSRELQERLMVSEATVQAQAEQLQDYRELLGERRRSRLQTQQAQQAADAAGCRRRRSRCSRLQTQQAADADACRRSRLQTQQAADAAGAAGCRRSRLQTQQAADAAGCRRSRRSRLQTQQAADA